MILSVRTILSANGSIKNQTVVAAFTSEVQSTASRAPQATSKEAAESTSSTSVRKSREWLSYWTMVAFAFLVWRFPILGPTLFQGVRSFRLGVLFFVLWLQFPLTNGAGLGLRQLKRLIGKYVRVRHASMTSLENSSFVLRALVALGTITDEQRIFFAQVLTDGGNVILLSAVFLMTPGFVTEIGCLLVGVGYPIYASVACVAAGSSTDITGARSRSFKGTDSDHHRINRNSHTWWLMYWIVFIVFLLCHDFMSVGLSWLPLWYHGRLVGTVWLQLPYFRGAEVLFVAGVKRVSQFHSAITATPLGFHPLDCKQEVGAEKEEKEEKEDNKDQIKNEMQTEKIRDNKGHLKIDSAHASVVAGGGHSIRRRLRRGQRSGAE